MNYAVPDTYESLTVVTTAGWVARDLAAAGTVDVIASPGFDLPAGAGRTALWCSGAWAMRLLASGISHPFLSAGPAWMTTIPDRFLGRQVLAGQLGDLGDLDGTPGFFKLAEHKHSGIPAAVYRHGEDFRRKVAGTFGDAAAGLDQLHCMWSEPVDFIREYRCFIAHGTVTAASFYRGVMGDGTEFTWDAFETVADRGYPGEEVAVAADFAQLVVDAMGTNQPPGYSLDIGKNSRGRFMVIEANAAWSSNIYHCLPAGVIDSVLAAQDPRAEQWLWRPDEVFTARARPLPGTLRPNR